MGLAVGGTDIGGAYVGSTAVSAIYLGADKVWPTVQDWLTTSNLLFTYNQPADQYTAHVWESGSFGSIDTGGKWVGGTWDRVSNININGSISIAASAQITLEIQTTAGNPGAGTNTGFTTFKLLIGGSSGWNPTTLNLARTSAAYTTSFNSGFGFHSEQWVWDAATTGLTRTSNGTFRMLAGSGLLV